MKGYLGKIEKLTLENENFRRILYTAKSTQLVLMTLQPMEEIGEEIHASSDQFFRFEQGEGKVIIDGNENAVINGDAVIVPAGSKHNVINTSTTESLKLYTLYCPPHHRDGIMHTTKEQAAGDDESFDGKTTE